MNMDDIVKRLRSEFLPAILHGDDEHRAWLTEAVAAFLVGKPITKPRGSGSADEIAALKRKLDVARGALEGLVDIQDVMETEGACDYDYIEPRLIDAREALKELDDA